MPGNLKDILSHLSTDIDKETLLLYLQGKLPDDKKHELEKQLIDNEFAGDAVEGLQTIRDQQQISFMVDMLNRDLKKKTEKKKKAERQIEITGSNLALRLRHHHNPSYHHQLPGYL